MIRTEDEDTALLWCLSLIKCFLKLRDILSDHSLASILSSAACKDNRCLCSILSRGKCMNCTRILLFLERLRVLLDHDSHLIV